MAINLVVGEYTLNVVSAYAPQVGLDKEIRKRFWEDLDGGDFNGHIGRSSGGYDSVHGGFGFGNINGGGTSLLEYAKAFELVIANSCYPKKAEHLIAFRSTWTRPRLIIYLFGNVIEVYARIARVIPSENLTTQHMLLIMDLEIR
uniref:Craniofacial development protein 2-like n=1 Tax=Nicotiana tabacum TaxID=4097 RepID=A0A1S4CH77_TOBAC|nr:PREDICTED: uncharacterized protein LOC107818816 [Nicotiana tabacum]